MRGPAEDGLPSRSSWTQPAFARWASAMTFPNARARLLLLRGWLARDAGLSAEHKLVSADSASQERVQIDHTNDSI
jgi:hypothetical protein